MSQIPILQEKLKTAIAREEVRKHKESQGQREIERLQRAIESTQRAEEGAAVMIAKEKAQRSGQALGKSNGVMVARLRAYDLQGAMDAAAESARLWNIHYADCIDCFQKMFATQTLPAGRIVSHFIPWQLPPRLALGEYVRDSQDRQVAQGLAYALTGKLFKPLPEYDGLAILKRDMQSQLVPRFNDPNEYAVKDNPT
jgi:hypothetical protein